MPMAVGQMTPGPFLSTATFVGYLLSGLGGAVVSTAGIFLPSFFLVLVLNRALKKTKNSRIASAFLDATNISSVAMILKVSIELFHSAIFDADTAMIAVAFGIIEIRYRTLFIVIDGAAVGYLFYLSRILI